MLIILFSFSYVFGINIESAPYSSEYLMMDHALLGCAIPFKKQTDFTEWLRCSHVATYIVLSTQFQSTQTFCLISEGLYYTRQWTG